MSKINILHAIGGWDNNGKKFHAYLNKFFWTDKVLRRPTQASKVEYLKDKFLSLLKHIPGFDDVKAKNITEWMTYGLVNELSQNDIAEILHKKKLEKKKRRRGEGKFRSLNQNGLT